MQDLVVSDEEFNGYSSSIDYLTQALESEYESVVNHLRVVSEQGVAEGGFHDNLVAFVAALDIMQGQIQYLTNAMRRMADEFVTEIDEIDGSLY